MKVICRDAAVETCPKGFTICCHVCEHHERCDMACVADTAVDQCDKAEIITDELVQFQAAVPEAIQKITNLVQMKKQLEDQEKTLKEQLLKAMETYDVKSFENDHIKLVYVAPTTRSNLDSTRLKKDHPDIAQQYTKISNVSASVRIAVK